MDSSQQRDPAEAVVQAYEDLYRDAIDDLAGLPTRVKLVRALTLVQLGLARSSDELGPLPLGFDPAADPELGYATPREMGQQLKDSEYATLVELLASALKDLTGGPAAPTDDGGRRPWTRDARSQILNSRPRPLRRRHSVDSPSIPETADEGRAESGAGLFPLLDANLRLIARILRSQTFVPAPPTNTVDLLAPLPPLPRQQSSAHVPPQIVEAFAAAAESSGKTAADNKATSAFLRLPPELQRRILREARTLSEDASAWLPPPSDKAGADGAWSDPNAARGNGSTARRRTTANSNNLLATPVQNPTGIVYNLPPSQDPYPVDLPPLASLYAHQQHPYLPISTTPAAPPRPKGGRRGAQEYAHSVTTVCKDLAEVARRTAWETVHVRTRKQVRTLVALWTGTFDDYERASQGKGNGKGKSVGGAGGPGDGRDGGGARAARSFVLGPNDAWVLEDCSPTSSVASFESYGPHEHEAATAAVVEEQGSCSTTPVDAADDAGGKSGARREQLLSAGLAVRKMNVEVPAATGEMDKEKDVAPRSTRRQRRRRGMYSQSLRYAPDLAASLAELQSSRRAAADAESRQLPKLFASVPNLKELTLCINPAKGAHPYNMGGLTGHGIGLEGIAVEVLDALCGLKALRSLTLKSGIDFSDLEVLLPCLDALTELRLEGGVDSIDGRTDVDPDMTHRCKLELFTLQSLDFETGDVSVDQLVWILSASVGSLAHLDLIVHSGAGAAHNQWLNGLGGVGNFNPAFGHWAFADLLVGLGPTLVHLGLRDCSSLGSSAPDLNQPPHSGYLDYALLHCYNVRHLAVEWSVTGPALLDCLTGRIDPPPTSPSPSSSSEDGRLLHPDDDTAAPDPNLSGPRPLKTLTLFGSPDRTPARALTRAIVDKGGKWPDLETVTLAAFPSPRSAGIVGGLGGAAGQAGTVPWATREVRRLKEGCARRGVWLGFA